MCQRQFADGERMERAVRSSHIPTIVMRSTDNPCRRPYRMLDGAHRMCRLKHAIQREAAAAAMCPAWDRHYVLSFVVSEAAAFSNVEPCSPHVP